MAARPRQPSVRTDPRCLPSLDVPVLPGAAAIADPALPTPGALSATFPSLQQGHHVPLVSPVAPGPAPVSPLAAALAALPATVPPFVFADVLPAPPDTPPHDGDPEAFDVLGSPGSCADADEAVAVAVEAAAAAAAVAAEATGDVGNATRVPLLAPSAAAAGAAAAAQAAASSVDAASPADAAAQGDQLLEAGDFQLLQIRFQEAAVFLAEGENNIKFDMHPHNLRALRQYKVMNSSALNIFDLIAGLLLMALAICEQPAVDAPFGVLSLRISSGIELICLAAISVRVILMYRWVGMRKMARRPGTVLKVLAIAGMCIEALIVIGRNKGHLRLTRLLRPLFVIDNYYSAGARRVLRQIAQSFFPILDMLLLLLFFIFMFGIIGFYTFSSSSVDPNFSTLHDSLVSLFVLITTANFPDVMMPSYSANPWAFVFFLFYLVFGLYFLQNLLLAVVYDTFRDKEMDKFKKLYLHKREALRQAYSLLKDDRFGGIPYANFRGMMRYRSPRRKRLFTRLLFCALNHSETESINLQEFYSFYEAEQLGWKKVEENQAARLLRRRMRLHGFMRIVAWTQYYIERTVSNKYFEYIIDGVIVINTVLITYDAAIVTTREADNRQYTRNTVSDLTFVTFYWFEVAIKLIGMGYTTYFQSGWNRFDLFVTCLSTAGIFLAVRVNVFGSLRQLRILRLFKVKQRFRQILGTMLSLMPSLASFVAALALVFYSFAILGIELFSGKVYKGCCGPYFSDDSATDRYYLNNFDNIVTSYVTLFELMVVNNWFVIMNGHVQVTSGWARIYFMLFYILAVNVALNVVIAFILETFLSRMSFERAYEKELGEGTTSTAVYLQRTEVQKYFKRETRSDHMPLVDGWVKYIGSRKKTMADCQLLIFQDEVREWCKSDEVLRTSMLPVRLVERSRQSVVRPRMTLSQEISMAQRGSDNDLNAQEMVLVSSIMGDAAHRLPWAMPSQQERMLLRALARPSKSDSGPGRNGNPEPSGPGRRAATAAVTVTDTVDKPTPLAHAEAQWLPAATAATTHAAPTAAQGTARPQRHRSATFHVEPSPLNALHPDITRDSVPILRRPTHAQQPASAAAAWPVEESDSPGDFLSDSMMSNREHGELSNRYADDEGGGEDDNAGDSSSDGSYLEERDTSEGEMEYPTPLNSGTAHRRGGSGSEDEGAVRRRVQRDRNDDTRARRSLHNMARARVRRPPSFETICSSVLDLPAADRDALRQMLNQ